MLVESILQIANIPAISPSATSVELSSQFHKDFFRTVPPDNWQAIVMADIIELFNWTYLAAVGLDDSYGRGGISALEKESFNRKSFCVAFSEFVPRLGYQEKINLTVEKMKRNLDIGVIIVWLTGRYGRAFLTQVTNENLKENTFILSDSISSESEVILDQRYTILDGSLGMRQRGYRYLAFDNNLKRITPANKVEIAAEWWEEFWKLLLNCSTGSAKQSTESDVKACKANLTSSHAVTRLHSSFHVYTIDAVFALAHALNNIYNCSAPHGAQATNSCYSVKPTVKGSDLKKYLRNVSFNGVDWQIAV